MLKLSNTLSCISRCSSLIYRQSIKIVLAIAKQIWKMIVWVFTYTQSQIDFLADCLHAANLAQFACLGGPSVSQVFDKFDDMGLNAISTLSEVQFIHLGIAAFIAVTLFFICMRLKR